LTNGCLTNRFENYKYEWGGEELNDAFRQAFYQKNTTLGTIYELHFEEAKLFIYIVTVYFGAIANLSNGKILYIFI
jgi:hypothetical protein